MPIKSFFKHVRKKLPASFYLVNDFGNVDAGAVLAKIEYNSKYSVSYVLLLSASTIVCTLGLLLSSAPVVIGGMIISPMMWPLMKIAVGLSEEKREFVKQALFLLVFSIAMSLLSSYFITLISPVKVINAEISARTTPTLLDLIVAMVAGVIAALAIAQKKISDTLAGVAIATSLMPPLCVAGIGLALSTPEVAVGGFLLFFSNIVSIIFASVLVFLAVGIKRRRLTEFSRRGVLTVALVLLLTSIPLFSLLQGYSFRATVHQEVTNTLRSELAKISKDIVIDNVTTDVKQDNVVSIKVSVLMPKDVSLDYAQEEHLIATLENQLNKNIDLQLLVQELLSLKSDKEKENGITQELVTNVMTTEMKKFGPAITIDKILVQTDDTGSITVDSTFIADPTTQFAEENRSEIEEILTQRTGKPVKLNIRMLPLITLRSQPELEHERIKADIRSYYTKLFSEIEITATSITDTKEKNSVTDAPPAPLRVVIDMRAPTEFILDRFLLNELRSQLETTYKRPFLLKVNVIKKEVYE